jgi:hypothetical protein
MRRAISRQVGWKLRGIGKGLVSTIVAKGEDNEKGMMLTDLLERILA